MAALVGAHSALLTCTHVTLGSASSAGLSASSNVMSGSSNSAAGLRLLSLRPASRRGLGATQRQQRRVCYQGPSALFDRGTGGGEGKKAEKKFITKEEEPEQYWQTPDEREGKNPMTTPLPYIAILSVLSPFIILAVAFANNWIKIPVR